MKRAELEHIIRAACAVANVRDLVVIGSQAVLGPHPGAPPELTVSMEADVFPRDQPDLALQIDGAIGERSLFHETFGYFAHGVDEATAVLPDGWRDRLVPIRNENTGGAVGWCLDVHDLGVAKLVAGREKDIAFVKALLRHALAEPETLRTRARALPQPWPDTVRSRLERSLRHTG